MGDEGMIKLIFFDFDGTLLDSETYWRQAALRMLCAKNIAMPQDILQRQDEFLFTSTIKEIHSRPELEKKLGWSFEDSLKWCHANMEELYRTTFELKPHAFELVHDIKAKGIPMVVVTASEKHNFEAAAKRLGIFDCFSMMHSTYAQEERKNSPALFEKLAALYGAKPEECILVDDAAYALEGARKAGCTTIGIYDPVHTLKLHRIKAAAMHYCMTLEEVHAVIGNILAAQCAESKN